MSTTTGVKVEAYLARELPPHSQLIDGEVVVNEPAFRHQRISAFLLARLVEWTNASPGRGEAGFGGDWVFGDRNVFVPDVWWLREERRPARDAVRMYELPDLAVEVRSESTWRYDIGPKRTRYEQGGVAELWLVDTDSDAIIVNRRTTSTAAAFDHRLELHAGETLTTPLLPGLRLPVTELFDR